MAKLNLGSVPVKFFAQVGDAEQFELGSASIPLKASYHGRDLIIQIDDTFDSLKAMFQSICGEADA